MKPEPGSLMFEAIWSGVRQRHADHALEVLLEKGAPDSILGRKILVEEAYAIADARVKFLQEESKR